MPPEIRPAQEKDLPQMRRRLLEDAEQRRALVPALWPVAQDADARLDTALRAALSPESARFGERWSVAASGDDLLGMVHTVLVPVPPIYAGEFGPPGLLLPDCLVAPGAPPGMAARLIEAAETQLREDGAQIILAASVPGARWQPAETATNYAPLTLYLAKCGLAATTSRVAPPGGAAPAGASDDDVPDIVAASARHRATLQHLNGFWKTHPEADARFAGWMRRSLTLGDRDMLIARDGSGFRGYVIAQPATRMHFPPAHDIGRIGVIDDYHHADFDDPDTLSDGGAGAAALLRAAEQAFDRREMRCAFVVCPAAWTSKIEVLKQAGYAPAQIWWIRT